MCRFRTTLQCVSDILHCTKKIISEVSELHVFIVRDASQCSSTLIKYCLPNPLSEILHSESVVMMPRAKKLKVDVLKLFQKNNSRKKQPRPKNDSEQCRLEHFKHRASCPVPESARSSSESSDSDIFIVFDSTADKLREAQQEIITIDSDENEVSINGMGNSDNIVHGSSLQHNPGSGDCVAASWTGGRTCCADIQSSYFSELTTKNKPASHESGSSGDRASGTAATSVKQKGMTRSVQRELVLMYEYCV